MSRRKTFQSGRAWVAVAAFAAAGATAWAGEKIETSTATVVVPGNVATNKTGKLEEPSVGLLRFQERINQNESRFGWQRNLPGSSPGPGMLPTPAPVRRPAKNDKKSKDGDNWLTAPSDSTPDYEGALGVTMFQKPKSSATSAEASAAASGTPAPGATGRADRLSAASGTENPLGSSVVQDFIRPDSVFGSSKPDSGLRSLGGFPARGAASASLPGAQLPDRAFDPAALPERTLDSVLGRPETLAPSTVPTLDSILYPGRASALIQSPFQTGVDAVLHDYRPPSLSEPVVKPPATISSATRSLTLEDVLSAKPGGLETLDASKRVQREIVAPRGYLDSAKRPPAVLPGPTKFGF